MIKVSIIVPIYNVEKYLKKSIESLINQTLKEIEIILVNDGSTDNSLSICQGYALKDTRIKVVDKPNGGVSTARNIGLRHAQGEYIGFVDPDDWIEKEMYENMYNTITQTKSSICLSNYIIESKGKKEKVELKFEERTFSEEDMISNIISRILGAKTLDKLNEVIMGNVWRILIKREIIDKNNIRFLDEIKIMEDLIFLLQVLLKCNSISIDKGAYYHYINDHSSAMRSYKNEYLEVNEKVLDTIGNILKENNLDEFYKKELDIRYITIRQACIANELHSNNPKGMIQQVMYIHKICKDRILKSVLKNTSIRNLCLRKKMIYIAMRYNISIYIYIYYFFVVKVFKK